MSPEFCGEGKPEDSMSNVRDISDNCQCLKWPYLRKMRS